MKTILIYLAILSTLMLLKALGLISVPWMFFVWLIVICSLICLSLIGYGFAILYLREKKIRKFWDAIYNDRDDHNIYGDD